MTRAPFPTVAASSSERRNVEIEVERDITRIRALLIRRRGFEETELSPIMREGIDRVFGVGCSAAEAVSQILTDVRTKGDGALRHYSLTFDGEAPERFEIDRRDWDRSFDALEPTLRDALALAAEQIASFHRKQLRTSWFDYNEEGALGQIVRPLERVGIYTPSGTAIYPSSLLMTAIPARVAGVSEIIVCAPPGPDGCVSPLILAAAKVAEVDRLFQLGGAQAIAAMAYGTESVPRVDKICGPGNIFVVLAKRQVYGVVAIDGLPGPTETFVIADDSADPVLVSADMLAQAEHDPMASAILVSTSERLLDEVPQHLNKQSANLDRREIIRQSLATNGLIALVDDIPTAMELANSYAPEHLCLLIREPWTALQLVRHAGGVFLGEHSPEALGDYTAGPSHVMPTGGTARFASPIHIQDFTKVISVAAANERALKRLGPATISLAHAEGLTAHARAIELRLRGN
ncbi:MAG: histidinol dehydrogenase [Chloroflexia bacterium]|nr:histidinol dehydrogenase [Chloroflexia bacterium]